MSKRILESLSPEEKEADQTILRFASENGVLKCVGFRKGVFTYLDMFIPTGKFRLASEPSQPFDKSATEVKLNHSKSSHKTNVSIRVVTDLNEVDRFCKPAFEYHWTLDEWSRTYDSEWNTIQTKWPRPSSVKVRRDSATDTKPDQDVKRSKLSSDEIDKLVARLSELEISNRELCHTKSVVEAELESLRRHRQSIEDWKSQLVQKEQALVVKERDLAYWWTQKTEFERQQNEIVKQKDLERRQEERVEKHNVNEARKDADRAAYIRIKADEDARLASAYRGFAWRDVLIGLNLHESHDEQRPQAKKRLQRFLHPDGFHNRHRSMEERARAEARFVFVNSIL